MKTTRNLWPLGIITVCAVFVASTAGLLVFACTQKVELVSPDYYEQELRFQGHIDQVSQTRQTAGQASIAYDAGGKCITVSLPPNQLREQVSGSVELYRPSAAKLDRALRFQPDANGIQKLDAADLAPGLWRVRVSWTADKQNYYLEQKVVVLAKAS